MIDLIEDSPVEMLRQFAVHLNADMIEEVGAAKLILDNEKGSGSISIYEVFPGLSAWVYRITFASDFEIDASFVKENSYFFAYHHSGHQHHKFPEEDIPRKIHQGQNFILVSQPGDNSKFIIPSSIKYECCYLLISPREFRDYDTNLRFKIISNLKELFNSNTEDTPYRYFGDIDINTGKFVDIIVNNSRTDLIGRLMTEGAILNMLSSQLQSFSEDIESESYNLKITKSELSKASEIGDYISKNISGDLSISNLSAITSLGPKKLQSSIQYLYGCSVNEFVTNIRMETAKEMIQSTDKSISEICYEIGYASRSYFSKVFQKRYGLLPSHYKNSYSKNNSLYELSYRSLAKTDLKKNDIEEILKVARKENNKHNVTGTLIYHNNVFFQIIEGSKLDILKLYDNILEDDRHYEVTLMWQGHKPKRDFDKWTMAIISEDKNISGNFYSNMENLYLENLMGDITDQNLLSERLWRKARNILKVSN